MNLPSNLFNNYTPPQVLLCQPDKTIIGELQPYDFSAIFKFNTYSETTFTVSKTYIDIISGQARENPYYPLIDSLRVIYVRGMGHFIIQDVKENLNESDTKTITAFSLEYATSTKYLNNFKINTGEDDSLEYVYHIQEYGVNYSIDSTYRKVTKTEYNFDPYQRYYVKEYTDNTSYIYSEREIFDASEFVSFEEDLYVKSYPNIRFYWPSKPELSLLHIIFSYIPEWKINHVDKDLQFQERTFSEERISVYDFLYNTAAETFKYVMEWDSINGCVNFYSTEEDGLTEENNVESDWETDVYISRENLASAIDISYSTDDIRTRLKVVGGDGVEIRDVNLGQNYITNLSFYDDPMWLGRELCEKYRKYAKEIEDYTETYASLMSLWAAAYNEYDDLMNHVPVTFDVIRVGEKFEKLYCTYRPVSEEEDAIEATHKSLENKLKLFKVYEDNNKIDKTLHGSKADNVLLTLENANSDSATIRVYYHEEKQEYLVSRTLVNATSGAIDIDDYTLFNWVKEEITASNTSLDGFTIKSIGVLGAYLCSVKDETVKENIEDYGIRLLEEKQAVYTKIFITQTEGYMSKEEYQCLASDAPPVGEIADGTRWLDTDDENAQMYVYDSSNPDKWVPYNAPDNQDDFENYARFKENYDKLQVVQQVLAEKQSIATYLKDGVAITHRYGVLTESLSNGSSDYIVPSVDKQDTNFMNLYSVAENYFGGGLIVTGYSNTFGVLKFRLPDMPELSEEMQDRNEYAVYVLNGTPYIAYARSQGVCLAQMSRISELSAMDNYFTEGELVRLSPFMREDEYSDTNFILTGYESEEEQMSIKRELLEEAKKELKKISQPKLSFGITMANIMAIPEFACLKDQFQLGRFVRVKIRDGYVKRARLLEVSINFEDFADFSCQFGDLVTTKDEVSKTADLLQQAVQAGKTVASSSSSWQKGADKASALDKAIAEGLKDAALSVSASSGQSIVWNERGIVGRKLVDGTENTYEDEQFMLTNNRLVFTDDNWATSKGVFGYFTINGERRWGVLTDAVIGGYIEGSEIKGGSLEIGGEKGKFVVHEDGSVEILGADGNSAYATPGDFEQATGWTVSVVSDGPTIFTDKSQSATLMCKVFYQGEEKTNDISASKFTWIRSSANSVQDANWNANPAHIGVKSITVAHEDIENNATIHCEVDIETT